jgi:hypothetical protein
MMLERLKWHASWKMNRIPTRKDALVNAAGAWTPTRSSCDRTDPCCSTKDVSSNDDTRELPTLDDEPQAEETRLPNKDMLPFHMESSGSEGLKVGAVKVPPYLKCIVCRNSFHLSCTVDSRARDM